MARTRWLAGLALALAGVAGCREYDLVGDTHTAAQVAQAAQFVRPSEVENPLYVALPPSDTAYEMVFDRVYNVVDRYFDIAHSMRFAGQIETWPLMSAGFAEPWRLGFYDRRELLESTFQSIRRRCVVLISPAESGGYYVDVQVHKELEDLAQPVHASTGAAVFRTEIPIERQFEVVDTALISKGWIPIGRDHALEQVLLRQLRSCL